MPTKFILQLINLVFALVEVLLGFRIILKLLGASSSSSFVRWVYQTTQPLIGPFEGMFPNPALNGGFVIEFSTLFALVFYALVAFLLAELVRLIKATTKRRGN